MANDEVGEAWAAWLRDQFERHRTIRRPIDLSRAAGQKDNGRPVIDPSRVTQWLRGQRPSFDLAIVTAEAFGVDGADALVAAGYGRKPGDPPARFLADVTTLVHIPEPELPVGSGVDPELLAELAQADPAAIEAVRAVLKAARRGD